MNKNELTITYESSVVDNFIELSNNPSVESDLPKPLPPDLLLEKLNQFLY